MDERAHGIILRIRPWSETTLIVSWITAETGRIDTIAKGARRPKSPFLGRLDLFFEADISFQRSRRSDLHLLKEAILVQTHPALREDMGRLNAAAYFSLLLERTTESDTPLPEFYSLMRESLERLEQAPLNVPLLVCAFELKLLSALGLEPDISRSHLPPEAKTLAQALLESDLKLGVERVCANSDLLRVADFLRPAVGAALEKLPPQRDRALQGIRTTAPSAARE
jgi:DNA repair protein RecO (recombination protein O)